MRSRVTLLLLAVAAALLVAAPSASPSVARLRFKSSFYAPTHNPKVGAAWRYTLHATNLAGRPIGVTAKQEVRTDKGLKVDVIGWKTFHGSYAHTYRWPSVDRGKSLVFTVRLVGPGGTKVYKYKIRVV